jgi:23S rRNA G2069 N7-methylase RlmK/C1962 C5-methylase RlmI
VVRFDQPRLGDVRGLELLHLQCHIGTDTLSLARLGAKVTGLDFSGPALSVARDLARDCGADAVGAAGVRDDNGEYRLRERPDRIPASYTLQAIKD